YSKSSINLTAINNSISSVSEDKNKKNGVFLFDGDYPLVANSSVEYQGAVNLCYLSTNLFRSLVDFAEDFNGSGLLPHLLAKAFFRGFNVNIFGKKISLENIKSYFSTLDQDLWRSMVFRYPHIFEYAEILNAIDGFYKCSSLIKALDK